MADCESPKPPPALTREDKWAMWESVRPLVRKLVRQANVPYDDRDDLSQDIALEAMKAFDRYDAAKSKLTSFVSGVAAKVLGNYRRARVCGSSASDGGFVLGTLPADYDAGLNAGREPEPVDILIGREEQAEAEAAGADDWQAFRELLRERLQAPLLDRLTPESRAVVELILSGLSTEQAAVRLGRPPKDVRLVIRNSVKLLAAAAAPDVAAEYARHYAEAKETREAEAGRRAANRADRLPGFRVGRKPAEADPAKLAERAARKRELARLQREKRKAAGLPGVQRSAEGMAKRRQRVAAAAVT